MGLISEFPIDQWEENLSSFSLKGLRKWAIDQGARSYVRAFQPFLEEDDDLPFVIGSLHPILESLDPLLKKERSRFSSVLSPLSVEEGEAAFDRFSSPFLWQIEGSLEPILCVPSLLFHKTKQGMDGRSIVIASQRKLKKGMEALGLTVQETAPGSFWEKPNLRIEFSRPKDPWVMAALLTAIVWALEEHRALLRASCYAYVEKAIDPVWGVVLEEGVRELLPQEISFLGVKGQGPLLRLGCNHLEIEAEHGSQNFLAAIWNAVLSDGLTHLSYQKKPQDILHLFGKIRLLSVSPSEFCHALLTPAAIRCLDGVIAAPFLPLCHDRIMKRFAQKLQDHVRKMLDFFRESTWPLMEKKNKERSQGIEKSSFQTAQDLERILQSCHDLGWEARIQVLLELGNPKVLFLQKKILEYQSNEKK